MSDLTVPAAIGTAVAAVATVIYGYYALYPRREGAHRLALWMLPAAFINLTAFAGSLFDIGYTQRADSVEAGWLRWVGIAALLACVSSVFAAYNWFDLVWGWGLTLLGVAAGVCGVGAVLTVANGHWTWFSCAVAFLVAWLIVLALFSRRTPNETPKRASMSHIACMFLTVGFVLATLFVGATLLFSSAMIGSMSEQLEWWFYMGGICVMLCLPIVALFDYRIDQAIKSD